MNDKKICFITAVNNERDYAESLKYIGALEYSRDYILEAVGIRQGSSMTSAYNEAIKLSDAKYKIYIHQDLFIINKRFIFNILDIFQDEKIGMIGMVGTAEVPSSGIWWEGASLAGAIYDNHTNRMEMSNHRQETDKKYSEVALVDGICICTQYDIPWREDIFDGWHFYDSSQSLEFARKGYKCVVPNQETPWCLHDCGIASLSDYEKYRNIFIKEYLAGKKD